MRGSAVRLSLVFCIRMCRKELAPRDAVKSFSSPSCALRETEGNGELESDKRNERRSGCVCGNVRCVAASTAEDILDSSKRAEGVGCEISGVSVFKAMCNWEAVPRSHTGVRAVEKGSW